MNRVNLSGYIASEIKKCSTTGGQKKIRFTVAVKRVNGKDADFPLIEAWEKKAELVEKYFEKGKGIEIEGHISTSAYTDKDGNKIFTQLVSADKVEFPKTNKTENPYTKNVHEPLVPDFGAFVNVEDDGDAPFA